MSSSANQVVRVGVATVITDSSGKVIVGVRKGSHGAGTLAFPGGHLEVGESWFDCAKREVKEETGLDVKPMHLITVTNDVFPASEGGKHYNTFFVLCKRVDETQEPEVTEPDKCEGWKWVTWEKLVEWKGYTGAVQHGIDTMEGLSRAQGLEEMFTLFLPLVNLIDQHHPDRPGSIIERIENNVAVVKAPGV